MEVEVQEPEARFHTIIRGALLSKIAKEYYSSSIKYQVIFEAKKLMLRIPT